MRIVKTHPARLLLLFFTLWLCHVAFAQDNPTEKDLPNFHRVNDTLYRGGQPTAAGLKTLRQRGIKTIINLRDDDDRARAEEAQAVAEGFRYFNLPLGRYGRPDEDRVAAILSIVNASDKQPVFVHCHRGSDRTGTIIAIYRIDHDGWTSEQAKEEAKQFGLGFWQTQMKDYVGDYYRRKVSQSKNTTPR
jgi:tyrosine-protein phosphatase SIW14